MTTKREQCYMCGSREMKIRDIEDWGWQITCTLCGNGIGNYYNSEVNCERGWNERQNAEGAYIDCKGYVWPSVDYYN